nr:L-serine ammonia-lyase, iron-sulfur-dependent, subunit alpha [Cupriavidus taiwanensis]
MSVSIFDIFKVEIGPLGSPAVGPMSAACHWHVPRVDEHPIPYAFRSGEELLRMCKASGRTMADLMLENEKCWRSTYDIRVGLLAIAAAMGGSIARDRPVGVIPAVLQYYRKFVPGANQDGVVDFLLTAAAIGIAYREDAANSEAEVGGRREVGVACAMAAAGLVAVLGGSIEQIANAVEIGLEHNLVMAGEPVEGGYRLPVSNAMPWMASRQASRQTERKSHGTY